jgi:hypothetical protein
VPTVLLRYAALRAGYSILAAICLLIVPAIAYGGNHRDQGPVSDIQVKAAFIFNFAKFVQWPADVTTIVIGVVGDDMLGQTVARVVEGRAIGGRPIVVRRLRATDSVAGCHVVHISNVPDRDTSALLAQIQGAVLTVGETPRFLRDGGMVRMFVEDQRMRFEINRRQTDLAGLKISAQLLSLAAK